MINENIKNFSFSKYYRKFNSLSLLVIILSVYFIIFKGLNLGVDFKGGTLIEIRVENKSIEMLKLNDKNKFDIIFALEIIEHIDDPTNFLEKINPFIRDNGLIFISSINKNLKSLLFAKIAAEYFLGWVPKGTHDWQKFIEPNKLNSQMAELNYDFITSKGIVFDPIKMAWKLSEDLSINYISSYQKLI